LSRQKGDFMQSQWFVIHTLAGQEQKVKESIEKRLKTEEMGEYVREVLVPMEKVAEVRNGKKTVTTRKLHPGYVYIDVALLDENQRVLEKPWYFVRDTQGIIGFVGGERPVPVSPEEIEVIKAQIAESEDTERPKVSFEVGETVKINDGPFLNFSGVIEEIDPDKGKLKVTVNVFGRKYYGEESCRANQVADSGGTGKSRAAGRTCAGPAGRQHHGVLQGIQRRNQRPGWNGDTRCYHGLSGQIIHLHHQVAPRFRALEEGRWNRVGIQDAQQGKSGKGHSEAGYGNREAENKGSERHDRGRWFPHRRGHRPQHGHRSHNLTINRGRAEEVRWHRKKHYAEQTLQKST
jgi:transcriptional antiterminator NusG